MFKNKNWFEDCKNFVWHPYRQSDLVKNLPVKTTKASFIYLEGKIENLAKVDAKYANLSKWIKKSGGEILLDGISSWWSVCHGYLHKSIAKVIVNQVKKLPHIMFSGFAHKPAYLLCKKLCKFLGFGEKVFLADSGSIAIEVAIKISHQYYKNIGVDGKNKILSFYGNYHGDSVGAMGVSGCDLFANTFKNFVVDHYKLILPTTEDDFTTFDDFLLQNHHAICGVLIEPLVQCAGGMLFYGIKNLQKLCQIIQKYDVLLIFDECATGFYRTGKKFAFHHLNLIQPNIITLSKALSGGFIGLGACVVDKKTYSTFNTNNVNKAFMHGPTFMANPVACSAALASIDLFIKKQKQYQQNIDNFFKITSKILLPVLQIKHNNLTVIDVRILGMIACVEIKTDIDIAKIRAEFARRCLWIRPLYSIHGTIAIYLMPNFAISQKQVIIMCEGVLDVLESITSNL